MVKKIPTVLVEQTKNPHIVRIWCPFCCKWHYHAGAPQEKHLGHRLADCGNKKSPFRDTGYYLKRRERWKIK